MGHDRWSFSAKIAVLKSLRQGSTPLALLALGYAGCAADEKDFFDEAAASGTLGQNSGGTSSVASTSTGGRNSNGTSGSAGASESASGNGGRTAAAESQTVSSSTGGGSATVQGTSTSSSGGSGAGGSGGSGGSAGQTTLAQSSSATGSPRPQAGSCDDPIDLGSSPNSASGSNEGMPSSFAGECGAEGPEVAFLWAPPAAGRYEFTTVGSEFETALYLFSGVGCDVAMESAHCATESDAAGTTRLSAVLPAEQPVTLLLDSVSERAGSYQLNIAQAQFTCSSQDLGEALGDPVASGALPLDSDRDEERMNDGCEGGPPWLTFAWSAPAAGDYVFHTLGSNYDTVMYVYPACGVEPDECNDDGAGELTSEIELSLQAGEVVIIDIGVWSGELGNNDDPQFSLSIVEAD